MKFEILAIFSMFLLLAGCAGAPQDQEPTGTDVPSGEQITNFEECAAAGYPVMESEPRQCALPDGTTFVEELADDELPESIDDVEVTVDEDEWIQDLDDLEE